MLSVKVTSATTNRTYDLTPMVYDLRYSTQLHVGCASASFSIAHTALARSGMAAHLVQVPPELGYNNRIDILDGSRYLWSGRMGIPGLELSPDGLEWRILGTGYGATLGDNFEQTRNVQNTLTSTIVANAITNLCPDITATDITATGYTITNTSAVNLLKMSAGAQIAWAALFGDSSTNPQQWYTYPNASTGAITFTYEPRPTTYGRMRLSDFEQFKFAGMDERLANRLSVEYNSAASYATVNDTTLQGTGNTGWNLVKEFVAVIPQITQSADATQAANTILTARKQLRLVPSGQMVLRPDALVLDSTNHEVPLTEVRAGQAYQLTDVQAWQSPGTNIGFFNSFVVAETEWDESEQVLTITPENFESYFERTVAKVYGLLTGRNELG